MSPEPRRRRLVSEPLQANAEAFVSTTMTLGTPLLPHAFRWRTDELVVAETTRTWTSNSVDRGDTYRDRHWFEFRTSDGRIATVYFDRHARRDAPRWWLYTIETPGADV